MMIQLTNEQEDLLTEYLQSGLSRLEFCKQKGIKLYQLDYIRNKKRLLCKNEHHEIVKLEPNSLNDETADNSSNETIEISIKVMKTGMQCLI